MCADSVGLSNPYISDTRSQRPFQTDSISLLIANPNDPQLVKSELEDLIHSLLRDLLAKGMAASYKIG